MKRLIFLSRFFIPDYSATSQIVSDLAIHLAASGFDVPTMTSRQLYDDPEASPPGTQERGVAIHRLASTRFGRSTPAGRGADALS